MSHICIRRHSVNAVNVYVLFTALTTDHLCYLPHPELVTSMHLLFLCSGVYKTLTEAIESRLIRRTVFIEMAFRFRSAALIVIATGQLGNDYLTALSRSGN